jgi:hypothetical protein
MENNTENMHAKGTKPIECEELYLKVKCHGGTCL